jgi:hypothetical protein
MLQLARRGALALGEVLPEVRAFFERYPIPAALLNGIASLDQEGGDEIYLQIFPPIALLQLTH